MMRATNGRRVLVACGDVDMRRICDDCLRHVGYDVVTVENPDHVLAMMHRVRPHLVITSFPTATATGQPLTEAIRADAEVHATPILNLASWLRPADLAHARSAGVTESVPIPVSLNALVGAVRRLIGPAAPVPDPPVDGRGLRADAPRPRSGAAVGAGHAARRGAA